MKISFNLVMLLFSCCLLFTCCQQINSAKDQEKNLSKSKTQHTPKPIDDPLAIDEDIAIEPPRTASPPPPPPAMINTLDNEADYNFSIVEEAEPAYDMPPPPPVIQEIPEEEIKRYSPSAKIVTGFKSPMQDPLSTFSIDVDNASYSQVREHIMDGRMPSKDLIRIEELVNYFEYDYKNPTGEIPFSVNAEISNCPWNTNHQLVHIGLQGRKIPKENVPPNNLVFLLDVSGSMNQHNKLPLLKKAFKMLINELRPQDRVAIVVYAGASGVVLPSTPGTHKRTIELALDNLNAGGGTAGAEGIQLAYKIAKQHFVKDGNNRIILATDGDFNVGPSSKDELVKLIEWKRKQGIYLSVLGFGMNHYGDQRMEQLADNGNGNYAYIDNIQEARKVLVKEFSSTLLTIAKDVKIQIEFNPSQVKGYRLIGYENRMLANRDFNDDQKDAGELGAGHTVTALYEIIPANSSEILASNNVDALKYQQNSENVTEQYQSEWMTVKLRYKNPESNKSKKIETTLRHEGLTLGQTSNNFRFSAAVAGFGMLLKEDPLNKSMNYNTVLKLAQNARGNDKAGYRAEFIRILELAGTLNGMDRHASY